MVFRVILMNKSEIVFFDCKRHSNWPESTGVGEDLQNFKAVPAAKYFM